MKNITIDYLILTKNADIGNLITTLKKYKSPEDKIIILDDFSDISYLSQYKQYGKVIQHKLDYDYSAHRNYALDYCKGNYIFAIDDDEIPAENLLKNLKQLINNSNMCDLLMIPRKNIFKGCLPIHALQYGWNLKGEIVNWDSGDYQTRLFKNKVGLRWQGKLHERIVHSPANKVAMFPKEEDYCLFHYKTISEQLADNTYYQHKYTQNENMGVIEK